MSRTLKPQKVSEVSHNTLPIKIEIMLDRNDLDFFFEIGSQKWRAPDVEAITRLAREHIAKLAVVEWQAVIDVYHETRYGHRSYFGNAPSEPKDRASDLELSFERYERGKFDGVWKLKRKHILDVEADSYDMKRRTEQPHAGDWYNSNGTIIPYTDEAWARLHAIVAGVHDLNKKLEALLSDENKAARLLAGGPKLLLPFVPYDETVAPASEMRKGKRR